MLIDTTVKQPAAQRLYFDIDQYADGNMAFKNKLVLSMIDNVNELQQSLRIAIKQENSEIFSKACHKVKPTIGILNDKGFADTIELLKVQKENSIIEAFEKICQGIIAMLEKEVAKALVI